MIQRKWKVILQYVRLHIIMVAIYGSLVKDNYKVLKIDMNNSSYFEICTLSVKHGLAISSAPSIFEIKWASGALIRRNAVLKKLGNTRFHCVKIVQIRRFFWFIFSCSQSEYMKIRTIKNSVFGHFLRSVHYFESLSNG